MKKSADKATNIVPTIVTVVTPITSAIVVERKVPIIPVKSNFAFLQVHLKKALLPFVIFAVNSETINTANDITDIIIAIIIKLSVIGIIPNENSIPTPIPTIKPNITPIKSQTEKLFFLHPHPSIDIPPLCI